MNKRDRIRSIEVGKPAARHRASKAKRQSASRAATTVRGVMVSDVVTITPAASVADAAGVMEDANIGMLPVVEDGHMRGIITDRDIVVRAVARNADAATTRVDNA